MGYYKGYFKTPGKCKNHKGFGIGRKRQTQEEYEIAYNNFKEKDLRMVPCPECGKCKGYVFAGADSGSTPFCYNFEEKEK